MSGGCRRIRCAATPTNSTNCELLAKGRPLESLTAVDIRGAVSRAHAGGLTRALDQPSALGVARVLSLAGGPRRSAGQSGRHRARAETAQSAAKSLSVDDATRLMDSPPAASPEGLRDHAMLELFYSSGLRLAELVGLDARFADADGYRSAGWLKLDAAEVEVLGKGNRRRIVPVGSKALDALRAWLDVREQIGEARSASAVPLGAR